MPAPFLAVAMMHQYDLLGRAGGGGVNILGMLHRREDRLLGGVSRNISFHVVPKIAMLACVCPCRCGMERNGTGCCTAPLDVCHLKRYGDNLFFFGWGGRLWVSGVYHNTRID